MTRLKTLGLMNNTQMAGALPSRLVSLRRLEGLLTGGTDLCAPADPRFQNWLESLWKRRVEPCSRGRLPMAVLTQAVQSREFPVPLVAGEEALLRVFVTASRVGGETIPPVRARFYVNERETYVVDIPGKSAAIPTEVQEKSLDSSANATIPGPEIRPGLELVVEVDPDGTLDPGAGLTKRIPETGRMAIDVQTLPVFDLTVIPFLLTEDPDSSVIDLAKGMAADPEGHELLWMTRMLLPVGKLDVTAHEPVLTSSRRSVLHETEAIRVMEGGSGHYMGMSATFPFSEALQPGRSISVVPHAGAIAHELGHNLNLSHAPCGNAGWPDPSFPETDGSIGAWGYDFREGGQLVPPSRPDLMSYCGPDEWISDYHFTNALRYRLQTAATGASSSLVAAPARSLLSHNAGGEPPLAAPARTLLLWGGVDTKGAPYLEPAFVVDAPASLPRSTGEHQIIGRTAAGDELFSLTFEMPKVADGDGRSSVAFALPSPPEWANSLASITLSGPGGSVTLDQNTNRPVTILRNPRSGQIRAILRGAAAVPPDVNATVSALSLDPGLERLTSRGIPDPEDWTR